INALKTYFSQEMIPLLNRQILDQVDARIIEVLQQHGAQGGNSDALVEEATRRVADQLNAAITQVAGHIDQRLQILEQGVSVAQPAQGEQQTERKSWDLMSLLDVGEALLEKWSGLQERRLIHENPLVLAAKLQEQNPIMAQIVGSLLNPDPMAARMPGLMADVAKDAMRAGMHVRASAQQAGPGVNPLGGSPEPYGAPSGGSNGRPTHQSGPPGSESDSAYMTSGSEGERKPAATARDTARPSVSLAQVVTAKRVR
ncbi:MAG: hypothetical protein Q8R28_13490, partial [Dehalococcoidia bacterium]|nr:hypothetical protein [Dehalococcoidia bacterium]